MKKRILSLFLCLALVLGMMPLNMLQVQAAGTVIEKTIPGGNITGGGLLITAEDLGLLKSDTAVYTWQITKGDVDYTGKSIGGNPLTASDKDKFAILPVDGNCILDGATIKLFVSEQLLGGDSVEVPTNVLVHVMHTPKAVLGSLTNTWYQGDEQHYHVCKSCGVEYGHEDHTASDWILDEEGSTEEQIKRYKECTECGHKMAEDTIAYGDSVIKSISVSNVDIPATGESCEDAENTPESMTYGGQYQLSSISFEVYNKESDEWEALGEEDAILDNTTYRVKIGLAAATGYTFDEEEISNADMTINETKGTLEEITEDGKYAFICKEFRHNCEHSFTEKIEDEYHHVEDTGNSCKSAHQYYYDCKYCDVISSVDTWTSDTYGPHNLDENNYCDICEATVYDVWVGSTEITSENAKDVFGDETVSYNPETKVLTLNGYKNEGNVYKYGDGRFVGIFSKDDLNLELSGSNEITFIEGGEDDETVGILSEAGGVTISGDKDAELNVEAMIPIYANRKHVIVYGGNLNLSGTVGIMAESLQMKGGSTTIEASRANAVLSGLHEGTDGMDSTGKTLEVTGGNLHLKTAELGKFVLNSSKGAYMAPDFGGYKGCKIKGYIPPRAVVRMAVKGHWEEYDPENLGKYCEIKLEKIPEDQAITSVEIGNFQIPTIGQKLDDIVNTPDTLTYQGNYKMVGLGWNKYVDGGDGEELDENEPLLEGETYEISLTVFTDCEWGFPTDLKAEDVTINGEAVNDIYKSYNEDGEYLTMNLKFTPKPHTHSFTEKKKSDLHFVTDSGSDCLSPCKYYYECAYCDEISTEDTWASSEYGPHDLDANSYCRKCNATIYGINVGGRDITDKNAADVFGDGKVSYDKSTNTLTLNEYTYEGDGVVFAEDEYTAILSNKGVNIQLLGENTIKTTEDMNVGGIVVLEGDCTISGTGTLTVLTEGGGIALAGGCLTVKSGNLVLGSKSQPILLGIMALGVNIEDGDIDIIGTVCGICAMVPTMGIDIKGGNVSISTADSGSAYMVMDYSSGAPVPCAPNLTEYENYKVTASENADGSDAVEYNPEDIEYYKYVEISPLGHVHRSTGPWQQNETHHWQECECGEKQNLAAHTPDHTDGATEEYAVKCTVCMYEMEPQLGHTHVFDQEVVADGYKATEETCIAKATYYKSCACGEKGTETFENGELADHTEGSAWVTDNENHWHICAVAGCEVVIEGSKAAHTFDSGVITKAATETETGIKTHTCSVCKVTKTEVIPLVSKKPDPDKGQQPPAQETTLPPKGATIKDATGASYKVTKSDAESGTVTYTKPYSKVSGNVTIADTVTIDGIVYKVTAIEANAFKNNKKITKVTIGKNVTSIGKNAFMGCTKLTSVTIGKKVKTIGASAFSGCSKLKTVKMGDAVTTIGDKAFYKCTALTKITIPSKVSKIGKSAFYGCKKLKDITIKTTKLTSKKVGSKAFKGTPKNATVKVPKKSLKAYKKFLIKKGIHKKAQIK